MSTSIDIIQCIQHQTVLPEEGDVEFGILDILVVRSDFSIRIKSHCRAGCDC